MSMTELVKIIMQSADELKAYAEKRKETCSETERMRDLIKDLHGDTKKIE